MQYVSFEQAWSVTRLKLHYLVFLHFNCLIFSFRFITHSAIHDCCWISVGCCCLPYIVLVILSSTVCIVMNSSFVVLLRKAYMFFFSDSFSCQPAWFRSLGWLETITKSSISCHWSCPLLELTPSVSLQSLAKHLKNTELILIKEEFRQ